MRLLADENFPGAAVASLSERGHDVLWIRTEAPGSRDREVLERANGDGRTILTFDKDFGELAFRFGLPALCGVVLFRISASSPTHVAQTAVTALESRSDWAGHFAVIDDWHVRLTPLPS